MPHRIASHAASTTTERRATDAPALGCVVPGELYIGGWREVQSQAAVEAASVTAFCCLAAEIPAPGAPKHASPSAPVARFPLLDAPSEKLPESLPAILGAIDRMRAQGHRVVVYCRAGKSRSVSVAMAWLHLRHGVTLSAALRRVRAARPEADPALHFLVQLRDGAPPSAQTSPAIGSEHEIRYGPVTAEAVSPRRITESGCGGPTLLPATAAGTPRAHSTASPPPLVLTGWTLSADPTPCGTPAPGLGDVDDHTEAHWNTSLPNPHESVSSFFGRGRE